MEKRDLYDLFDHLEQVMGIYQKMLTRHTDYTTEQLDWACDHMERYIAQQVAKIPLEEEEQQETSEEPKGDEPSEETETINETNDEEDE